VKLLVFSDTHHHTTAMLNQIQDEKPDVIIHLGDCLEDADDIRSVFPEITTYSIRGNCDFGARGVDDLDFKLGGFRFYITHGHRYHVKQGLYLLESEGETRKVDVVLFGHTHIPYMEKVGPTLFLNPGSSSGLGWFRFARITLGDKIEAELCKL